jgi:hypothetical protein
VTVKAILRCAPILTKDDLMDVEKVRHREMFQTGSLTPVRRGVDANGKDIYADVPVCINHEKSNVVGVVTHLREDSDPDTRGRWLFAHARIDKPPGWLNQDTSVSISYKPLSRSFGLGGDWRRVHSGWLTEISLLDPSREPAHPRARLVWLERVDKPSTTPAAALTTSDLVAAGDTYDERPPVWDELERIVGYRVTVGSTPACMSSFPFPREDWVPEWLVLSLIVIGGSAGYTLLAYLLWLWAS